MINRKEHLNTLRKIVEIKNSINKGLTSTLIETFPNLIKIKRPQVVLPSTIDLNWLVGFVDGEGCFNVNITNSKTHIIGFQVTVRFILTQHSRDLDLMKKLVQILGCGNLSEEKRNPSIYLTVTKLADINDKVISLFSKYSLQSSKKLEFTDFCNIVELMKNKAHLTSEGFKKNPKNKK